MAGQGNNCLRWFAAATFFLIRDPNYVYSPCLVVRAPVVERRPIIEGGEVSGEDAEGEQNQPEDDAADGGYREEKKHSGRGVHVPLGGFTRGGGGHRH